MITFKKDVLRVEYLVWFYFKINKYIASLEITFNQSIQKEVVHFKDQSIIFMTFMIILLTVLIDTIEWLPFYVEYYFFKALLTLNGLGIQIQNWSQQFLVVFRWIQMWSEAKVITEEAIHFHTFSDLFLVFFQLQSLHYVGNWSIMQHMSSVWWCFNVFNTINY